MCILAIEGVQLNIAVSMLRTFLLLRKWPVLYVFLAHASWLIHAANCRLHAYKSCFSANAFSGSQHTPLITCYKTIDHQWFLWFLGCRSKIIWPLMTPAPHAASPKHALLSETMALYSTEVIIWLFFMKCTWNFDREQMPTLSLTLISTGGE